MNIRNFLQPFLSKIILSIAIFIFLPALPRVFTTECEPCITPYEIENCPPCPEPNIKFWTPFYVLTQFCSGQYYFLCIRNFLRPTPLSLISILGLVAAYILSSAIIYLWNRSKGAV